MFKFSTTFIFGEYIFGAILELFAFCGFGYLILKSRKLNGPQLSYSMNLYVCCCFFQSFFGFIHLAYLAIYWQKDTVSYNAYYFFFTGTFSVMLLLTIGLCVNFLSIDRMLILLFPMKYNNELKKITVTITICFVVLVNVLIIVFDMGIDFPTTSETNCRAQTCLRVKSQAILYTNARYCISAANVIAGIALGIMLKKHLRGNSTNVKANRVIVITMVLSFIFDFIPHLATIFLYGSQVSQIQGPQSLVFGSIEVSCCALLYCKNLLKPFHQPVIISSSINKVNTTRNI